MTVFTQLYCLYTQRRCPNLRYSTCFGHICSPSSGGILYTYSNWYVSCFSVDFLLSELGWNSANRQSTEKHNTYQLLYIYSIPPDDGLQICLKHVEVDWRNKLRINSVSCWFSLHGYTPLMKQIFCNSSNYLPPDTVWHLHDPFLITVHFYYPAPMGN
jgi:hypothetical protein